METSENTIIQACQAGNMESFVLLYDQYAEKIYNFLFFRTFHKETAEDLTSQVFYQAMDKIQSFNPSKGTFQAWLYQIARNALIDESRKRRPVENIENHFNIPDNTNLEQETQLKINAETIQKLLTTLPEEAQELMTMRLWAELSYAEIAQVTGKTEGSLKMQFSRIITKLQQHAHLLLLALIFARW